MYRGAFAKRRIRKKGYKIQIPGNYGSAFHATTVATQTATQNVASTTQTQTQTQTQTVNAITTQTATIDPCVKSFCIQAPRDNPTELETKAFEWIVSELTRIVYEEDSIVPIIPSTNSVRMSHQTPQALRIFFSATSKTTPEKPALLPLPPLSSSTPPAIPENNNHNNSHNHNNNNSRPNSTSILSPTTKWKWIPARNPLSLLWQNKNMAKSPQKTVKRKQNNAKNFKKTVRRNMNKAVKDETEKQKMYAYGLMSVLSTTGFHPSKDVKIRPYSEKLKSIVGLLEQEVKKHLSTNATHHTNNLNFNSLEVKIYHGKDVYRDQTGSLLVDDWGNKIRDDCNKKVNLHNDLCFSDDGVQSPRDTARGDHPIATVTIGSPRKLTFVHKWKTDNKWENGKKVDFQLDQGSIFVLLPDDEIPEAIGTKLHKTQHAARFGGEGISVALVFRSVKTKSVFHKGTHRWRWKEDKSYKKRVRRYLTRNSKRHKLSNPLGDVHKGSIPREVKGMMANIYKFLDRIRRERFCTNEQKS